METSERSSNSSTSKDKKQQTVRLIRIIHKPSKKIKIAFYPFLFSVYCCCCLVDFFSLFESAFNSFLYMQTIHHHFANALPLWHCQCKQSNGEQKKKKKEERYTRQAEKNIIYLFESFAAVGCSLMFPAQNFQSESHGDLHI